MSNSEAEASSSDFIQVAKACIAAGDYSRAIELCKQGSAERPRSILARVLWGCALLREKRPAEAMDQFDAAMAVDKNDAFAFKLVADVMVQEGMYRSALPILKKARALSPVDEQLDAWLAELERALAAGTTPDIPNAGHLWETAEDPKEAEPPMLAQAPVASEEPSAPPVPDDSAPEVTATDLPAEPTTDPSVPLLVPSDGPFSRNPPTLTQKETPALLADEVTAPIPHDEDATRITPSPVSEQELSDKTQIARMGPPVITPVETPVVHHRRSSRKRGLLHDVPESPEAITLDNIPKAEITPQAAKAIAHQYEKELRHKLEEDHAKKASFIKEHGLKIGAVAVLTIAVLVGIVAFWHTHSANRGRTLTQALAEARQSIAKDTDASYRNAEEQVELALRMDEDNPEAFALGAYANALLFAEHGNRPADKQRAEKALEKADPESALALVSRFLLAEGEKKEEAKRLVLRSALEDSEVQEAAGRILLAQKEPARAVDRFKRALNKNSNNVRALVALGNYYREFGDCSKALAMYSTAQVVSVQHAERAVGAAECRLERGAELDEALADLDALPLGEGGSTELSARRALVHAKLLIAQGRFADALKKLSEAAPQFPDRAFEFQMAQGEASRAIRDWDGAQKFLEMALAAQPKSESAKEALGKVLIAQDREREVLSRFPEADGKRVALVRGIALFKLGETKRARTELLKTQTGGKFPSESVMYLALADAADGQAARAQEVLEKALSASKKNKGEIRVALGQVYWRRGAMDKAKSQFEEASRDPLDYEGSCALGRLLYSTGDLDGAIAQLQAAVKKNPAHGEARNALGHALLSAGKSEEALAHFSEWQLENPKSALAQQGYALALFRRGKLKESEEALGRAMRLDGQDDESFRLRSALLFSRGDPRAAFSALERALKLNGKSAEAQCDMGNAYLRQMSYDKAKRYFESASKLQSRGGCGRVGLALATLGSGGRPPTAEMAEWVKDSNDSWERAEAQAALARVLVAQGSAKEAKKWAEQAVAAEPQLAAGHWVQGLAAARSKEYDKAKEALFRAETLDPAHAEVHLALAELLSHSNSDLERAYQEYQLFLKTSADKAEQAKVKRLLPTLKKRLASR